MATQGGSVHPGGTSISRRRGSMFDASMGRLATTGSSMCTFGEDPNSSETYLIKKISTRYQNTYKLEPDVKFDPVKVQAIAKEVLMDSLEDIEYNLTECRHLVKSISEKILRAVKNLDYKRYKIISLVHIGQLKDQGTRVSSRCLWDDKFDNWTCASYEGRSLWATATVYGIYYE